MLLVFFGGGSSVEDRSFVGFRDILMMLDLL
jgi:hypothetical protein